MIICEVVDSLNRLTVETVGGPAIIQFNDLTI